MDPSQVASIPVSGFVAVCYSNLAFRLNFDCYSVNGKQNIEKAYNFKKEL
jgi:hypothetical protein